MESRPLHPGWRNDDDRPWSPGDQDELTGRIVSPRTPDPAQTVHGNSQLRDRLVNTVREARGRVQLSDEPRARVGFRQFHDLGDFKDRVLHGDFSDFVLDNRRRQHLFLPLHPSFQNNFWFHFWFGYFPIYHPFVYPRYVTYRTIVTPPGSISICDPVYSSSLLLDPSSVPYLPQPLTQCLIDLADYPSAVSLMEEAAFLFKRGDYVAAASAFAEAGLLAPDSALPRFGLGVALFATGQYDDASFAIRRGMERMPDWPSVGTDLHELYDQEDDLKEHTLALQVYVTAHPDDADVRFLLGYVSFFSGDLTGARACFEAAGQDPCCRAECDAFLGRIEEVEQQLSGS